MFSTISTEIYLRTTESARNILAKKFIKDESGVTAVEYAIIAVAMSAIALALVNNDTIKTAFEGMIQEIGSNLGSAKDVNITP